jgi:sulfonate transport system substrate-binding protein
MEKPMSTARFAVLPDRRTIMMGALAMGLAACGRQNQAGSKSEPILRVAIVSKGEQDPTILFPAAGVKTPGFIPQYSRFESGHLVIEALNGGSLDYGSMSEIPPVFAAASPIHSFRQIAVAHGDVNNQVVLVPKGSRIETLADLKGKRIGYVRATTSQYYLILMLKSVRLTWADITPVPLGVPEGAEAFDNGALDAWAIYGFPIQRAIATQGARVLKTALGILSGNYIVSAHVDALADPVKSDLVGRYLQAVRQGYKWSAAHEDQWAPTVAQQIGVPVEYVLQEFHNQSDPYELRPVTEAAIASQQQVADVFADAGVLSQRVDVRPLWDNRYNAIIENEG